MSKSSLNFNSVLIFVLVCLFFGLSVDAKTNQIGEKDSPLLLDEFGELNSEQLQFRLEVAALEIQKLPTFQTVVITYRDKDTSLGFPVRYGTMIKMYLTKNRGIEANRVKIVDGGLSAMRRTQIYLIPSDIDPYILVVSESNVEAREPSFFDRFSYPSEGDDAGCCAVDEYREEAKQASLDVFAQQLKDKPEMKGYLIFYGQYCTSCSFSAVYSRKGKYLRDKPNIYLDSQKSVRAILKKEKDYLIKHHEIDATRILVINGGYREWRALELYLMPKDSKNPKVRPTTFPRKRSKIKI